MPIRRGVDIPSTVLRSPPKTQRTYAKAKSSAERSYGSGERAARTAIATLKHGFEKVGDRWRPKEHQGPSDLQAKRPVTGHPAARHAPARETYGGVDAQGHTRDELYARARSLGLRAASRTRKAEPAVAIARKQR